MNSYEIVTDFSWEELLAAAGLTYEAGDSNSFFDAFDEVLPQSNFVFKNSSALKDHLEDLFNLLYNRYSEWYCAGIRGIYDSSDVAKETKRFMLKVNNIAQMTYDKYATRIEIFNDKKEHLMAQVQAGTIAKTGYNDTPQNESSGGFEDATHRTTFTKVDSQSLTDGATPIERIDEIDRKIKNIMLEWCEEFRQLFWED